MLFKSIFIILKKQLRFRSKRKFNYLVLLYLCARFFSAATVTWRLLFLKHIISKINFNDKFWNSFHLKIRNRDLSYKFKKVGFLRNYLKRSKLVLRLKTRKIFLVTNFSTKNAKVLNWSPYFSRYRKHSTLSQFLMLSNIITFLKKDAFITTIVDDSAAPKFLGSRLLLTKMLKIFRKSQFFCIIKITSTNVFFTITNGCGEVKLCCSAGQVGFIKRKTRKKSLVFVKMIDYIIFKLGLNLLSKLDRLSFINTPKFLVYKIIAEFIARGIALNKVWFYMKTSHSNFNKFKFKKLRRI